VKIITDYSEYENYVNEKYTKDFVNLFKNNLEFPYLNTDLKNKGDLGLIQHFHKSIYEAHRKNKPSPIEAWNDKELIYKCALNRLKYMGHCKPSDILQGFNVTKLAPKISVFKPELATSLIKKYLNEYTTIIDPFSGFSGRLLGSHNCDKNYVGFDINEKHVQESKEIINYKQIKIATVETEDLIFAQTRTYEHAALFTCPPYGGKEHWNNDNDEVEKTCDEWIDLCIEKHKCSKYLFVVDETEKYKDYIVETLTNTSHFGSNNEYVILIDVTR
jgi:tRNA G10  N-methylase Trm11